MIKQLEYAESILRSNPMNALDIAISDEFQNSADNEVVKDALFIEVKALWLMSHFEEGIERAEVLNEMAINSSDIINQGHALNVIGNIYYDLSNHDKALDYYMKGLSFARQAQDKKSEAALLNNIGEIYRSLEAYDEAHSYYTQSMIISKAHDEISIFGMSQLNIGEAYFHQGKIDEAFEYAHTALNYFSEKEDYISISYTHFLLARIYRLQNRLDKSKSELMRAIDIMRRLQDHYNLSLAYIEMVDILIAENLYEDALEYIEDGIDISERLKTSKDRSVIALYGAEIFEKTNEYSKSLEYYKIYVEARFKYEKEKEDEHIKNINAQVNIDNAMHEKEIYRLRNVELRKKTDEIQKLYNDMNIINNIGRDITSTLDIKEVLNLLYDNVNQLMDATTFGIYLYDQEKKMVDTSLFLVYGQPLNSKKLSIDNPESLGTWCIRNKEAIMLNNIDESLGLPNMNIKPQTKSEIESRSVMVVPLLMQDEAIGAITVQSTLPDAYKTYHFNLIKALSSFISIAIKNSAESQKLSSEINERIKTQNELELLNEKLSRMSYMDALTQIPNRRSFVEYFSRELNRAKRINETIALLIIDIDYFKEYNDNYGHVEGDRCLYSVAQLLKKALRREVDFVARYGGDEFVAVMTDVDTDGAYLVAEEMKAIVNAAALEHIHSPIEDIITMTIGGIVTEPKYEDTMEQIIHFADNALYIAKGKGRNQISFYDKRTSNR